MGVAPLATSWALVMALPPLTVIEVSEAPGPMAKVPLVVSPVPAGVVPVARSLSLTWASVPPTVPSVRPENATLSSTGVMLNEMVLGVWSVSTPPLATPPLSRTLKLSAPSAVLADGLLLFTLAAGEKVSKPAAISMA